MIAPTGEQDATSRTNDSQWYLGEEAQVEGTRRPHEENTMAASEVYYMNARSESPQTSLVAKMLTVFEAAGIDQLIKPGDLVAIKIHCGEWNNTAYLRPVYPRA